MAFGPTRRDFLKYGACLAAQALLPVGTRGATKDSSAPPNFVFILVDDLGWADVSCYGSDLHETPNIDRLAQQAMRFTDAYAAAPVCSPTRASIMTGKYPAKLHMTIWYESSANPPQNRRLIPPVTQGNLPHEQVTIAEVLKEAGYFTAHVGKWHLGDAGHYPETQGFDVNIGGTFWGAPATFFYPYGGSSRWGGEFRYVPHLEFGREGEYLTDRLTDEAISLLDKVKDKPFFLNLCYHTVHTPIEGKPELVQHYKKKVKLGMRHQNYEYAAMVHSLDENVGRILAKLNTLGIADRTVVIFFSDNGGFINKYKTKTVTDNYPLRSGKGSLYEGGVRAPLIVKWPGVTEAGSTCREAVSSIDFYRTILDISGRSGDAKHNAELDGLSLVPLLRNPNARLKRDALYWHYPHYYPTTSPVSSVRQGDWKLLEYFEDDRVELYNLTSDMGEQNDLSEEMPERVAELRRRLEAWRRTGDAQMPVANPRYKSRNSK
ncbi:MAG: sulfatase [Phycisphaerales bacterium]|nr:MAG: sulfatase [Phycisphaerales bacterium]